VLVVVNIMDKDSEPSQAQPTPEDPIQSIEEDVKGDGIPSNISEELWKAMMDVVLAIYDVREAE
jgi:chromatin structure-remodeling complex subunit RSC1/2